jgi:hypothetical protein
MPDRRPALVVTEGKMTVSPISIVQMAPQPDRSAKSLGPLGGSRRARDIERSCYHRSMKRLILILMLALVPLQFAWAAAGAYCLHEEGASSLHFGHHAHTHQAKSDTPDSKTKINKVHLDCSSCHASASVIWISAPSMMVMSSTLERYEPGPILYSSFIPDGPRRPDRLPGA